MVEKNRCLRMQRSVAAIRATSPLRKSCCRGRPVTHATTVGAVSDRAYFVDSRKNARSETAPTAERDSRFHEFRDRNQPVGTDQIGVAGRKIRRRKLLRP